MKVYYISRMHFGILVILSKILSILLPFSWSKKKKSKVYYISRMLKTSVTNLSATFSFFKHEISEFVREFDRERSARCTQSERHVPVNCYTKGLKNGL